ncbi:19933_t:CDS:2, partial [Dentiscutata erythropus]
DLISNPNPSNDDEMKILNNWSINIPKQLCQNYDSAYSLCMTAISKLSKLSSEYPSTKVIQIKIWCLYISLIAALLAENPPINTKKHEIKRLIERTPEKVCEEVYTTIVTKGYNNEDGEIPGEIILA